MARALYYTILISKYVNITKYFFVSSGGCTCSMVRFACLASSGSHNTKRPPHFTQFHSQHLRVKTFKKPRDERHETSRTKISGRIQGCVPMSSRSVAKYAKNFTSEEGHKNGNQGQNLETKRGRRGDTFSE